MQGVTTITSSPSCLSPLIRLANLIFMPAGINTYAHLHGLQMTIRTKGVQGANPQAVLHTYKMQAFGIINRYNTSPSHKTANARASKTATGQP